MSAPVDVLAIGVIAAVDNCAFYLRDEAGLSAAADQMEAVSAAVAELIEADKEYDAIRVCRQSYPFLGMDEQLAMAQRRRAAALARVQGVSHG